MAIGPRIIPPFSPAIPHHGDVHDPSVRDRIVIIMIAPLHDVLRAAADHAGARSPTTRLAPSPGLAFASMRAGVGQRDGTPRQEPRTPLMMELLEATCATWHWATRAHLPARVEQILTLTAAWGHAAARSGQHRGQAGVGRAILAPTPADLDRARLGCAAIAALGTAY